MIKAISLLAMSVLIGGTPILYADGEPVDPPITEEVPTSEPETSESEPSIEIPSTDEDVSHETSEEVPPVVDDDTTTEEEEFDLGAWFERNFPPEVISNIVQGIVLLGAVFKVLAYAKQLTKTHITSMDDVQKLLTEVLKNGINEEVAKAIDTMILPLREGINDMIPYFETFSKVLTLSQDNSPEARVAILNLLQDMGKKDNTKLIEETKAKVEAERKANEEQHDKEIEELNAIADIELTENKPTEVEPLPVE